MKPHKHAELIKAWADGAEIEWRYNKKSAWHEFDGNWCVDSCVELRIKPEPKPDVVAKKPQYRELSDDEIIECSIIPLALLIRGNKEIDGGSLREAYLESARRLLFFTKEINDRKGETGELKSAKVLK